MKKYADRMGLVFAVAAACLACCLISFSSSQRPEPEIRSVTTLEGMRHELAHVQMDTLPTDSDLVVVDGGEYLFEPVAGDLATGMLLGALISCDSHGHRCWPVTLFEDPNSRDTVILDAEGGEVGRLPCDADYYPGWVFDMLCPFSADIVDAAAYNPARVALAMRLVRVEDRPTPKATVPDSPDGLALRAPSAKNPQGSPHVNPPEILASMLGAKQAISEEPMVASLSSASIAQAIKSPDASILADPDSDGDGLSDSAELSLGKVVAWGLNTYGQCTVPASLSNVIAVKGGIYHTLALRTNGSVIAWGQNTYGQCTVPASATNMVSVAAGAYHSLALRKSGFVVAWGQNTYGQCTVPASASNVVALAAGMYHSVAVRTKRSVVAWGQNTYGQCTVPASATNVVAVAAGTYHSLALRANGTVVAWGQNSYGQCTIPASATNAAAVAAGQYFSFALGRDGRVVAWGQNTSGQCTGASNYTCVGAVSAGANNGLAIRRPNPLKRDTDGDGMPDGWEVAHSLDPLNAADALLDVDTDGLSSLAEYQHGTDPTDADTDDDDMPDGWEAANGLDPLNPSDAALDADGDDFFNVYEYYRSTSPTNALSLPLASIYVNSAVAAGGDGTLLKPYSTIRAALQAATDYAILQVADGVYTGADNRDLSFLGKPLMLVSANGASRCVIDCQGLGGGVVFENGENALTVLRGFSIRNGRAEGGAIRCLSASPLIQACRFEANGRQEQNGGAVYNAFSKTIFENCVIARNSALSGGAIYNDHASPFLRNCTLADNAARSVGHAIYNADTNSLPVMVNCIVWGSGPAPLAGNGIAVARHCVIEGGIVNSQIAPGDDLGNICADPQLTGTYRLKATSPCIDAGTLPVPSRDIDGEGRYDDPSVANADSAVDIGADEFVDTDRDGMADGWERENFGSLNRDGAGDADADGLCDRDEYMKGCNPTKKDTDFDGMPDGWESAKGFDPLDPGNARLDSDGDGLVDLEEFRAGTDPKDPDTDKDGVSDFTELCWSRIAVWGTNKLSQCDVPASLTNAIAIAAGPSHNLALRADGTLVAWGKSFSGQSTTVPSSATNITAIAASFMNNLALRSDGVVITWGFGNVGEGRAPVSNVVAVAAGFYHSLALRPDGTVVAWGINTYGQCTVPASATNVIAIAAGDYHSLALRSDGTIVAWGYNANRQCNLPVSATNITAIAAGSYHNLAMRSDGSVIAWGAYFSPNGYGAAVSNPYGQCTVPPTATGVVAVAVGAYHSLAVRRDGKVIAWGLNDGGQCSGASNIRYATSIAAGWNHSIALRHLNPLKGDTDDDSMPDGWEVSHGLDPLNVADAALDADADGLSNLAEFTSKTDPQAVDSDGDGLTDGWELTYGFNPLLAEDATRDTDGDGLSDRDECLHRTNPKIADTDGDGMPDAWEVTYGFDPINTADASGDADGDGLTNLAEFTNRTMPRHADTDGDGMPDGWELSYRLNPLNLDDAIMDLDLDGILNRREYEMGSDPSAGYFMKESFDTGIPSDWMNSTFFYSRDGTGKQLDSWMPTPEGETQWIATWGSAGCNLRQLSSPYGWKGLNVGISGPNGYGASSLMTPWMNLGQGMTNVVLSFYYSNPSLYPFQTNAYGDRLYIYCRSRTHDTEGQEVFDMQEVFRSEGSRAAQYWKHISVRLPDPSGDCQVIFMYYGTSSPYIGVYVDEVSIAGDDGRVSQDLTPLAIETASALPSANRGIPYSSRLSVRGGLRPFLWHYQWSVVSNALPKGLELDRNTGIISGTPASSGTFRFSVEARSENNKAATNQFELLVREPAVVLSEKFDSGWLPQGWTVEGSGWTVVPGVSPSGVAGSNACYRCVYEGSTSQRLISPVMDLSTCMSNVVLRFWYRNPRATYLNDWDTLSVYCLNGQEQTCLARSKSVNAQLTVQSLPDSDTWRQVVLFLPRLRAATRIAFVGGMGSDPGGGIFLDDVEVLADYGDPLFLAWLAQHFPDGIGNGFYDDSDADGLTNIQEYLKGADPKDSDTDDDGLKDGDEVARSMDSTNKDSDNDGLTDGEEVLIYRTNPLDPDTDHDGLSDGNELLYGTDPLTPDTDGDGMSDGWEVRYSYPPLVKNDPNKDSDNDGLTDGQESLAWTDPFKTDTDRDGMNDYIEVRYGLDPNRFEVYADSDNDGLSDKLEKAIGTDPSNRDFDGDGMPDGWEFYGGLDPRSAVGNDGQQGDPDGDGLCNFDEYINGTCPSKVDTDCDGVNDGIEVTQGSDPCDPSDKGQPPPASAITEIPFSIGGDYASWEMTIQGLGPADKRMFKLSTDAPGDSKTNKLKLRKGNSYRITMRWLRSKYSYPSWYCWEAKVGDLPQIQTFTDYTNARKTDAAVSLFGEGWYVDNREGLLTSHTHVKDDKGGNIAGSLSATLYVLKIDMAMDGNRDGVIEFDKAEDRQSIFWVNNDRDVKQYNEDMWQEDDLNEGTPNCDDDTIGNGISVRIMLPNSGGYINHTTEDNCLRDLEDFTRLHVRVGALPAGMPTNDITCFMRFEKVTEGDPKIKVFKALKTDQSYLQTMKDAVDQVKEKCLTSTAVTQTTDVQMDMQHVRLNSEISSFLIEGCSEGAGELTVVLKKAGAEIAKTSVFLSLNNIINFCNVYEVTHDLTDQWNPIRTVFPTQPQMAGYEPETEEEFLLVHGWNMETWEKRRWVETAFKRLWWQGYKGRVSSFEWPTLSGFGTSLDTPLQLRHFDNSEYRSWISGQALANLIQNLNVKGQLRMVAHSMGNVVAGEAIRNLPQDAQKIHTYIACQAALSAQYYHDVKDLYPNKHRAADRTFPNTPDVIGKYLLSRPYLAIRDDESLRENDNVNKWVNYYNYRDWALDKWSYNSVFKPDGWGGFNFRYTGRTDLYEEGIDQFWRGEEILQLGTKTERFQIFSYIAESRSCALGQVALGKFNNWNLETDIGYDDRHYSHSREFRSNSIDENKFWSKVFKDCSFVKEGGE